QGALAERAQAVSVTPSGGFIVASRIPLTLSRGNPGQALNCLSSCRAAKGSNWSARRRDQGTGPRGRGVNARQRESDFATVRQLLLSFEDRRPLGCQKLKG